MLHFVNDRRGSAVQWFALAAVAVSVASLAGAHALDWLSQSGRVALVAYRAPAPGLPPVRRAAADQSADPGVDMAPTGSIPSGSVPQGSMSPGPAPQGSTLQGHAIVIRIR